MRLLSGWIVCGLILLGWIGATPGRAQSWNWWGGRPYYRGYYYPRSSFYYNAPYYGPSYYPYAGLRFGYANFYPGYSTSYYYSPGDAPYYAPPAYYCPQWP